MEFDQRPSGRVPLPFQSIDTGMSLERLASVLQYVPSNFDTDLFTPIHARMRELLGHDPDAFEAERFSYQVIADHARAITFLIADGVLPSNEGRGYVLRRIVRRAVRHGRLLGRREPFLATLATVVIEIMADAYPFVRERETEVLDAIEREEAQFARTLDAGTSQLEAVIGHLHAQETGDHRAFVGEAVVGRRPDDLPSDAAIFPGDIAFKLHDTFGFPIDLTVEMAAEHGFRVDRAGFEAALAEQRERSRTGRKAELARHAELVGLYESILRRVGPTTFLGYETTNAEGRIVAILRDGVEYEELTGNAEAEILLDRTPFYAEGGGQVGDRGELLEAGDGSALFMVADTQRPVGAQDAGLIVHRGTLHGRIRVGETVSARVDPERRARTMRNHTGTHLLHRALRNVVGDRSRQAGSEVTPEGLRFDFPLDRGLTVDERRAIEAEVRRIVREARTVTPSVMTMDEAIAAGADAFFDEKYGERVRTVRVDGYSHELCGGTHCANSGQVGSFVITGERSIGSGLRRIEALTGDGADAWLGRRLDALERTAEIVGAQSVEAVPQRVAALGEELREARRRLKAGVTATERPGEAAAAAVNVRDGIRLVARSHPFESSEAMKAFAKDIRAALDSGVIAIGRESPEPELFVSVSDDLVARGVSADALVKAGAIEIGGRGGGRPQMGQAKGTDGDGLGRALEAIRGALEASG